MKRHKNEWNEKKFSIFIKLLSSDENEGIN